MKTRYFANRDIFEPQKCYGIIKIESENDEMSAGYYFDGSGWVRDDRRALEKAYGDNMDYFEIEESELEECMKSKREQVQDAEKRKAAGDPNFIRE